MRQVYKGNVSIPYHVIKAFLTEQSNEAVTSLMKELREAIKNIDNGLDKSNLTVCTGKTCYVDPVQMRRFLSGDIPRLSVYRKRKENHTMPLYEKMKPEYYISRDKRRAAAKKKDGKNGR